LDGMTAETHAQLASFIWSICNLLRGPYKRNEYRKVILPLTVLRRFDCMLAPSKAKILSAGNDLVIALDFSAAPRNHVQLGP
jgi:type I restriction enzyme M protein